MHIIKDQGICDPHMRVYNGRVYMFATHDRSPGNPDFRMDDWKVFSTDDLVNWNLEYTLRPEDTYIGRFEKCYATDSAERNGKYYFYFSKDQESTGVAVADAPEGPYTDALGKPLLPQGLADTPSYDPAVFIDDDEARTPYILWGYTCFNKKYHIARLNEDMISLAEEPRPIEHGPWWSDAPFLWKRKGVYYLLTHRAWYSTADNVYGPYTYRGKFCHDCNNVDHPCVFEYHNQTYFAYGVPANYGRGETDPYYRATKIIYAHYKDNGDIVIDEFIQDVGVGQYDATWSRIKGEWYFAASDGVFKKENGDGFEMRGITNGAYLSYPKVHDMRENATVLVRGSCEHSPCTIEVREGGPEGDLLGCCTCQPECAIEHGDTREFPISLTNTEGTHSLCFVFCGEGEDLFTFEDFHFDPATFS